MAILELTTPLGKLDKNKGGYYYLEVSPAQVNQFEKGRHTRLVCTLMQQKSFSCGLNHLGNGQFFIIVATRYVKPLGLAVGQPVQYTLTEDPNPLGVEVPEALTVLLEQDDQAKHTYTNMTDGKKRSLIYSIRNTKNLDLFIQKALDFLNQEAIKQRK